VTGSTGRRSVALVVHALPPQEASGAPLAAWGYARELGARGWDVTVLTPSLAAADWGAPTTERRAGEQFTRLGVRSSAAAGTVWPLDAAAQPFVPLEGEGAAGGDGQRTSPGWLLRRLRPQLVHVVDNVHLPLTIPEVAHRIGIPVVRSVSCAEDLCALIAPVSPSSGPAGYCEPPLSLARCARCVASSANPALVPFAATGHPVADAERRSRVHYLLSAKRERAVFHFTEVYDRVVFASVRFRTYFEDTLPLDPAKVRIVPMGVDLSAHRPAGRVLRDDSEPLRFLLAAMADPAKGVRAVVEAFTHPDVADRDDWRLVLAGGGDRAVFGPLLADRRVTDLGPYRPEDLPRILQDADVGLSTSVFESFHRVTREYLYAGLAVLGSQAFGITDAVVPELNGLLFDHAMPGSLRQAVLQLLDDRQLVHRLRDGALATPIRSVAQEVDELETIYLEVLGAESGAAFSAV
jgi:glycosyltransferase involved in cell wall biosynthesis